MGWIENAVERSSFSISGVYTVKRRRNVAENRTFLSLMQSLAPVFREWTYCKHLARVIRQQILVLL